MSINLDGYKSLKAFRFWCQKVLPIVYDDSLSYYELLGKVVNYINELIANNEVLADAVEDVISLVNSYENRVSKLENDTSELDERVDTVENIIPTLATLNDMVTNDDNRPLMMNYELSYTDVTEDIPVNAIDRQHRKGLPRLNQIIVGSNGVVGYISDIDNENNTFSITPYAGNLGGWLKGEFDSRVLLVDKCFKQGVTNTVTFSRSQVINGDTVDVNSGMIAMGLDGVVAKITAALGNNFFASIIAYTDGGANFLVDITDYISITVVDSNNIPVISDINALYSKCGNRFGYFAQWALTDIGLKYTDGFIRITAMPNNTYDIYYYRFKEREISYYHGSVSTNAGAVTLGIPDHRITLPDASINNGKILQSNGSNWVGANMPVEPLVVTFTVTSSGTTCSHTFAQINDALNAGRAVYANLNDTLMPMKMYNAVIENINTNELEFYWFCPSPSGLYEDWAWNSAICTIKSNGDVYYQTNSI